MIRALSSLRRRRGVLRGEVVRETARLEELAPAWGRLWREDGDAGVFASPAWLVPWWRHIGSQAGRLLTVAVWEGEALVALLPLYVYGDAAGVRHLFPLGIATTDVLTGLGRDAGAVRAAWREVAATAGEWDLAELPQLPEGAPLLVEAGRGWEEERGEAEPCLVLALSREGLASSVPARMRQNLQYYRRRAERQGRVRIFAADEGSWEGVLGALLRLHAARWGERGEDGVLADEAVVAAHRESVPWLLREGLLRMYALEVDGAVVAVHYGLMGKAGADRRASYYLGGFDPAWNGLSPGTLLVGHAIERAIEEGCGIFDFLRGREPYKYLWGAVDSPLTVRRLRRAAACRIRDEGAGDG